ncbi:hypothetical protein [Streptomyces sp. F-7]
MDQRGHQPVDNTNWWRVAAPTARFLAPSCSMTAALETGVPQHRQLRN